MRRRLAPIQRCIYSAQPLLRLHLEINTPSYRPHISAPSSSLPEALKRRQTRHGLLPPFSGVGRQWSDHLIDLGPDADYSMQADVRSYLYLLGQLQKHRNLLPSTVDAAETGRQFLEKEMSRNQGFFVGAGDADLLKRTAKYGWVDLARQPSLAEAARVKDRELLLHLRRNQKKKVMGGKSWALRVGVGDDVIEMDDYLREGSVVKTNIRAPVPCDIRPDDPRYSDFIAALYHPLCHPIFLAYQLWDSPLETILSFRDDFLRSHGFIVTSEKIINTSKKVSGRRLDWKDEWDDEDWVHPRAVVGDWDEGVERSLAVKEMRLPNVPWEVGGEIIS